MSQERKDAIAAGGIFVAAGAVFGFLSIVMGTISHSTITIFLGITGGIVLITLGMLTMLPERYSRYLDRIIKRLIR